MVYNWYAYASTVDVKNVLTDAYTANIYRVGLRKPYGKPMCLYRVGVI